MLKTLVLVSGWIEVLFGVAAMLGPALVLAAVGGMNADEVTLTLIRLLGAATFGVGIGALAGRNHTEAKGGLAAAYGLGSYGILGLVIYNLLASPLLILCAFTVDGPGIIAAAALHTVIALLFLIAIFGRR